MSGSCLLGVSVSGSAGGTSRLDEAPPYWTASCLFRQGCRLLLNASLHGTKSAIVSYRRAITIGGLRAHKATSLWLNSSDRRPSLRSCFQIGVSDALAIDCGVTGRACLLYTS